MPTLSESTISELFRPYLDPPPAILPQLSLYLDLLLKWNARTNLTAIREPEEIVRRHFGESLFAALHLDAEADTLLDFGSGAGFPGVPIALLRPDVSVTLAESQGKKASFLREAVRTLGLSCNVWPARVEAMPSGRQYHTVALRAVDHMEAALEAAATRASHALLILGGANLQIPREFVPEAGISLPNSTSSILLKAHRRTIRQEIVPRGTI